ncbi:MAG: T9SS type A sorting domain-containing protein [Lentimicrobiaceae bacterium]|jgi:hypothetical protein|nr:T9SS type A sorting domain-containing protein [Lentimicrobiaceae bacterium]
MKKISFLFFISLSFFTVLGQGNTWAPIGAQWYYSHNGFGGTGFYLVESTKDTLITVDGTTRLCSVLEVTETWWNSFNGSTYTNKKENQYMYSDDDKVYIYKMNRFFTLYDFSAQVGDEWEIPYGHEFLLEAGVDCEEVVSLTTGMAEVSFAGDTLINGLTLRYFKLKRKDFQPCETGYCWELPDESPIIEKIGPIRGYMLPNPSCILDFYAGGQLRCYSENSFTFETGVALTCDYLVSTNENTENQLFQIFPNPTSDAIRIVCDANSVYSLSITNVLGQVFIPKTTVQNGQMVPVSTLPQGMYIISVTDNQNHVTSQKLQIVKP